MVAALLGHPAVAFEALSSNCKVCANTPTKGWGGRGGGEVLLLFVLSIHFGAHMKRPLFFQAIPESLHKMKLDLNSVKVVHGAVWDEPGISKEFDPQRWAGSNGQMLRPSQVSIASHEL